MKSSSAHAKKFQPRFRIVLNEDIAMGPGKAEILEQLQKTGSIADAAAAMDMSYMRAWKLIKTMERCFKQPLVKVTRGGAKGGGAELTETGELVLKLYRKMEANGRQAAKQPWEKLAKLLAD